jgi:integrase
MASLYKNQGIWYLSVCFNNKRITRSLKTNKKSAAMKMMEIVAAELIQEHLGIKKNKRELSFPELVNEFLKQNTHWSISTRRLYTYILNSYLEGKKFPNNPTSHAIHVRHINCCWNWGLKNGLIKKANKLSGDTIGEFRSRVFNRIELNQLFESIQCPAFNRFVRFAYYTGARSGEIRSLPRENIKNDHIVVNGKTGPRMVKLNEQAKEVLNEQKSLWNYSKDFVSHKFKKECRKLGIKDARFHDLRRTFGYNLIKQGMSIYKVSKLLGHKSVRTTELHYAPLLTTDIEEFVL